MTKSGIVASGGAVTAFAVVATAPSLLLPRLSGYAQLFVAASFAVAGVLAWLRRPDRSLGRQLLAIGVLWSLWGFRSYDVPLLFTAAQLASNFWLIGLIYLLVVFPGSRLPSLRSRLVVAAAVILGFGMDDLVVLPLFDCRESGWATGDCNGLNLLHVEGHAELGHRLLVATQLGGLALVPFLVAEVRRRARHSSALERRASMPVVAGSLATLVLYLVIAVLTTHVDFLDRHGHLLWNVGLFAFSLVPFAFVLGLLRAHARRARVGDLVVELGDLPDPVRLQDSLRRALEDPSLVAAAWSPEADCYLAPDGAPLDLPGDGADQVATFLDRRSQPLAVIVHDRAILDDAALVESVKAATRLAVENERLHDELLAQLAEVHASRSRIVQAGDDARRRIERDLHDGAQQRLVALSLSLRVLAAKVSDHPDEALRAAVAQARGDLADALKDLRDIARGLHPAVLSEQGLAAAIDVLAERARLRVEIASLPDRRAPEAVETAAYYLCAEALSNAAKHASASRVVIAAEVVGDRLEVEVRDDGVGGALMDGGSGLRGLADRVAAVGGSLSLDSPLGTGTCVRATLPLTREPAGVPVMSAARVAPRAPQPDAPLVSARGVSIAYGPTRALTDLDLDIARGELVAIVGTNGAGKSTLLRVIAGLAEPSHGTVRFRGEDITYYPAETRARWGIAYVPGGDGVFKSMSVIDNLHVFARSTPKSQRKELVDESFEHFPMLRDRGHEVAGRLSRGQQQMLALAKAFVSNPTLLLVDELWLGLHDTVVEELMRKIAELRDRGATVLFVEQASDRALAMAPRAVFLENGSVAFDGDSSLLRQREDLLRGVLVPALASGLGNA